MSTRIIDGYELETMPLGTGTVGTVYRAKNLQSGETVAIKLLMSDYSEDPNVQRRFIREVAILQKLDHKNIVRCLQSGIYEDGFYFAMELVKCGTVKQVINQRESIPWRETAECAIQICEALQHAHDNGVIHRDLKPGNLFLADDGHVKLGDFGIARDLQSNRLTIDGQTVGTRHYMAPEQITGDADISPQLDLYSLGCVMYEMLTGRVPFDSLDPMRLFEQHLNETPPDIRHRAPGCPQPLVDLVMQMLEKQPGKRPQSAEAVGSVLVAILRGEQTTLPTSAESVIAGSGAAEAADRPEAAAVPAASGREPANLTDRLYGVAEDSRRDVSWRALAALAIVVSAVLAMAVLLNS